MIRETGTRRGHGTSKQPVFGILCRNGQVWAEIVTSVDEDTLLPLISKKVEKRIHHLFGYLESLYQNRGKRICPSSSESWGKTILLRKRESHQWIGRLQGILKKETCFEGRDNEISAAALSRRVCLEIQQPGKSGKG